MDSSESSSPNPTLDAHVVLLVNFIAPNLLGVVLELDKMVRKLTILCSVAVESNRQWSPEWGSLDVKVQKTKTITRNLERGNGYREINHLHFPYDTRSQLKQLDPDFVVSLEMGLRSLLASMYCRRRQAKHIIAVNASERTEAGTSWTRLKLRRFLTRRADMITYNGPSCRTYLKTLGLDEEKLLPWSYAADPRKMYHGELESSHEASDSLRCITVGQLVERKGIMEGLRGLCEWAQDNPDRSIEWTIVGGGPLEEELRKANRPDNLSLKFKGHCDPDELRELYRQHELLFFPTIGDEWGLVVDEAMGSGLVVIGSEYAQAVKTMIREDSNGWIINPEKPESIGKALSEWAKLSSDEKSRRRTEARKTVSHRTPTWAATELLNCLVAAQSKTKPEMARA